MDKILWTASTLIMLVFLAMLALRAMQDLLGIDINATELKRIIVTHRSPASWPWPVIFVSSLVILWAGSYFGWKAAGGWGRFLESFWNRQVTMGDSPHYLFIAEHGYVSTGDEVNKIVFYPFYPYLISVVGAILGGHRELAALVISQVSYGASAVFFARLARMESSHPGAALLAYWLYPFGFFSLGVYTEGLFLLLTILGLYLIRTRQWIGAGAVGFLCALTRAQGMLLLLPGVYCAWRDARDRGWNLRHLALVGPMIGFGIYLLINKIVCGDFFAFSFYENSPPWWQHAQWLGSTVAQQWAMINNYPGLAKWIYWPQLLLYFVVAAFLYMGYRRRIDNSLLIYGTAYLGMCYTTSWMISGGRYLLGCIPVYLCIGRIQKRYWRALILIVEFALFLLFYYYFMQGQSIM